MTTNQIIPRPHHRQSEQYATHGYPPIRLQPSGDATIEDRMSSVPFSCHYPGGFRVMPIKIQPSGSLPSLSE
eukprot:6484857-Amphidinium_carterae.1